jgi:hypothetical protein
VKSGPWDLPNSFDFDNVAAYTAFNCISDTVILFRNHFKSFMPNDTSNVLSLLTGFVRDDIIPGAGTGDTCWHFKIQTVNDRVPHYVNDCHFFSVTGLGFSVENFGGINRTTDGGRTWSTVYSGKEPLTAICMVSDTTGYVVGEKGTVVKLAVKPSGVINNTDNGLVVKVFPSPANDKIEIEINSTANTATLNVVDGTGRQMLIRQIYGSKSVVDISSWPSGFYLVSVTADEKTAVKKIIRE